VSGKRGSRPLSGAGAEGTGAGPRVVLTALGASILRATLLVAGLILMQPPSKVNTRGASRCVGSPQGPENVAFWFFLRLHLLSPRILLRFPSPRQYREIVLSPSMSLPSLWAWCQHWVCSCLSKKIGSHPCVGLWCEPALPSNSTLFRLGTASVFCDATVGQLPIPGCSVQ
jgi:hypothetical protein